MNSVVARQNRMGLSANVVANAPLVALTPAQIAANVANSTNPFSPTRIHGTLFEMFIGASVLAALFGSGGLRTAGIIGAVGSAAIGVMALRGIS